MIKRMYHRARRLPSDLATPLFDPVFLAVRRARRHAPVFPETLQVEPTRRCNLGCVMCALTQFYYKERVSDMSTDMFRDVLSQFPQDLSRVVVQGTGEPLLCEGIIEMIAEAKSSGRITHFNSNILLLDQQMAERLVELEHDEIMLSIETTHAERYADIRRGGDVDTFMNNLAMLRDCKERAGADRPVVSANIILMKHTLDDVPELLTKLKELGVSSAQFVDLCTYPEYEGPLTLRDGTDLRQQQLAAVMSEEEIWDKLNEFKSYGDDDFIVTIPGEWGGLKIAKDTSRTVFTCFELWKMPFLKPDGVLSTCCWAPQFEMGDFKEQTFEEIWFGDAYHDMRMSHLTNSHPQHCLECQELMRVVVSKDRSELRRQGAQPYEEVFLHK